MRTKIILACLGALALSLYVANAATPFTISSKVFETEAARGGGSGGNNGGGNSGGWGWDNPWGNNGGNKGGGGGHGGGHGGGKGDDKGPGGPGGPGGDNGPGGPGGVGMDLPPPAFGGMPGFGGPIGYTGPLTPQEMQNYQSVAHTELSGWQVVPPVCTDARGQFDMWTPWDDDRPLRFEMTTWGSDTLPKEVTLNLGFPGEDGQVLAYLCTADQLKQKRHNCGDCKAVVDRNWGNNAIENRNRVYIEGSLRADDLLDIPGCDEDDRLECIVRAIQYQGLAGGQSPVYVEVATGEFPDGELRGQLISRNFAKHFGKGHGKDGKSKADIWKGEGLKSGW